MVHCHSRSTNYKVLFARLHEWFGFGVRSQILDRDFTLVLHKIIFILCSSCKMGSILFSLYQMVLFLSSSLQMGLIRIRYDRYPIKSWLFIDYKETARPRTYQQNIVRIGFRSSLPDFLGVLGMQRRIRRKQIEIEMVETLSAQTAYHPVSKWCTLK